MKTRQRRPSTFAKALEGPASAYRAIMKKAEDDYMEEVYKIAALVREEIVIPFCDKHHIKFMAGNGTCAFFAMDDGLFEYHERDGTMICTHPWTVIRGAKTALDAILMPVPVYTETMPEDFPGTGSLGSLMDDYTPGEGEAP
jgi:hypothetical protein